MATQQEMDRVYGLWIEWKEAKCPSDHDGQKYYFCAQKCKENCDQKP